MMKKWEFYIELSKNTSPFIVSYRPESRNCVRSCSLAQPFRICFSMYFSEKNSSKDSLTNLRSNDSSLGMISSRLAKSAFIFTPFGKFNFDWNRVIKLCIKALMLKIQSKRSEWKLTPSFDNCVVVRFSRMFNTSSIRSEEVLQQAFMFSFFVSTNPFCNFAFNSCICICKFKFSSRRSVN